MDVICMRDVSSSKPPRGRLSASDVDMALVVRRAGVHIEFIQ
jgi:hypothetical protein